MAGKTILTDLDLNGNRILNALDLDIYDKYKAYLESTPSEIKTFEEFCNTLSYYIQNLSKSGSGNKFLSDDGTYKDVSGIEWEEAPGFLELDYWCVVFNTNISTSAAMSPNKIYVVSDHPVGGLDLSNLEHVNEYGDEYRIIFKTHDKYPPSLRQSNSNYNYVYTNEPDELLKADTWYDVHLIRIVYKNTQQICVAATEFSNQSSNSSPSGSSAYTEVSHGTSDTTFTLTPNTFHIWDEVSSLTLTLGVETSGIANEYLFQFTSGSEPTTLILPDNIKWTGGGVPIIEANKIYQISILKGLGSVLEWDSVSLIENKLTLTYGDMMSGSVLSFAYPTASELTLTMQYYSSDTLIVPTGTTAITIDWYEPVSPQIIGINPSSDSTYKYIM